MLLKAGRMSPTPTQIERQILETLDRLLRAEFGVVTAEGRLINVEELRSHTSFGNAANLRDEFLHRLQIMKSNEFVRLITLGPEGNSFVDAVVTLSTKGRERLLYRDDEQYLASQRQSGKTISNTLAIRN